MDVIKKLSYIFNKRQKKNLVILTFVMLIGSVLELIGVAAILPFVSIVSNPDTIHNKRSLAFIYRNFGFKNDIQFIIAFGLALVALYIVKNLYLIGMSYLQFRFTNNNQQSFTSIMMDCYMRQPYLFHVTHNIAELHRNVTGDVGMMFNTVLALIQMFNEITVCLFLLVYLFLLDKYITLGILVMLGIFAAFFLKVVRKKSANLGIRIRDVSVKFNKWIRQGFEGIKEIKIVNREPFYIENINKYGRDVADVNIKSQTINVMPRPLFEATCVSTLLIVVVAKIAHGADLNYFIPVLSAFAISAMRLLPSAGRITTFITTITYNKVAVDHVYKDLIEIEGLKENGSNSDGKISPISFNEKIELKNVTFGYPSITENVVEDINILIPKNKSVAFIGPSGAGKTTVADILLGLLKPKSGSVYSDNEDVYLNLTEWHKLLGYIPQSIYLIDDTIKNNILFGIPKSEADEEKVWKALEDAQLADFVRTLEKGLDTVVGERGVRLSGGQRQRIGIARALYNDPQILVLDEATSALDTETETAVMEAVDALHGNRTMVIIAHRLSTIKNCDYIYEIKNKNVTLCDKEEVFA